MITTLMLLYELLVMGCNGSTRGQGPEVVDVCIDRKAQGSC